MNYKNGVNEGFLLRAAITEDQKRKAKQLAKKKRMTFSGWLGSIIEEAIEKNSTQEANR